MRTSAEISDTIQYAGAGIFERCPLSEWRIPDTPTDGVPDYTPRPWKIGRRGGRAPPVRERPYLRIEVPTDTPEIPNPQERIPECGTVKIDYSVAPKYVSRQYHI